MKFFSKVFLIGVPLVVACSTEFSARECKLDGDCGSNLVCVHPGQKGNEAGKSSACITATSAPLVIGMSAVGNGPSQDLGNEMSAGISLAFNAQNRNGGIRGRNLELEVEEDGYDPNTAQSNAMLLLNVQTVRDASPRCQSTTKNEKTAALYPAGVDGVATTRLDRGPTSVLAILGNVGTPTMTRFAPIAIETQTLFFGAFTGANLLLRDDTAGPCKRFIFNVRASYGQEMRATMEYFIKHFGIRDYKHLISFDQKDTFGQAGYDGLVAAYNALQGPKGLTSLPSGVEPIKRLQYERESAISATNQAKAAGEYIKGIVEAAITETHTFGIEMTDTYTAGDPFIRALEAWKEAYPNKDKVKLVYSNVSFVGPNSLANRLKGLELGDDTVLVSQVVPNYMEDNTRLVTAYNEAQPDASKRNFTSFEGYISGRVFIAGLLAHKGEVTSENLVGTFETLRTEANIELGTTSGFSQSDHNYSKSVWGTVIQPDGTFKNAFFWREGAEVQVYN